MCMLGFGVGIIFLEYNSNPINWSKSAERRAPRNCFRFSARFVEMGIVVLLVGITAHLDHFITGTSYHSPYHSKWRCATSPKRGPKIVNIHVDALVSLVYGKAIIKIYIHIDTELWLTIGWSNRGWHAMDFVVLRTPAGHRCPKKPVCRVDMRWN